MSCVLWVCGFAQFLYRSLRCLRLFTGHCQHSAVCCGGSGASAVCCVVVQATCSATERDYALARVSPAAPPPHTRHSSPCSLWHWCESPAADKQCCVTSSRTSVGCDRRQHKTCCCCTRHRPLSVSTNNSPCTLVYFASISYPLFHPRHSFQKKKLVSETSFG